MWRITTSCLISLLFLAPVARAECAFFWVKYRPEYPVRHAPFSLCKPQFGLDHLLSDPERLGRGHLHVGDG